MPYEKNTKKINVFSLVTDVINDVFCFQILNQVINITHNLIKNNNTYVNLNSPCDLKLIFVHKVKTKKKKNCFKDLEMT